MPTMFPRHTIEFHLEEPKAFRRFSRSLVEMAIVTGILARLYRVVILTHGSNNWLYLAAVISLGAIFLIGMLTAHLGNYPVHQYLWRAPLFALVEVATEMATSSLLITLGHEANGTVRAHWDDWVGMGLHALLYRGLTFVLWGLILAGVVTLVREMHVVKEDEEPEEASTPVSSRGA
ncbi:MAG TPA: hypothetical protein VN706_06625 [Gemmatimonadaceae bacterium]|nr:hypothetical protein [Gemmatimonadaceae bacterium]